LACWGNNIHQSLAASETAKVGRPLNIWMESKLGNLFLRRLESAL
jgi:hypothetical protein